MGSTGLAMVLSGLFPGDGGVGKEKPLLLLFTRILGCLLWAEQKSTDLQSWPSLNPPPQGF